MSYMYGFIVVLSVLGIFIRPSTACNGYTLKVNRLENCVEDGVVKIENGSAILDSECNLILTGCINTKGFKTAKGKYVVKKAPMPPITGELDFCETVETLNNPKIESVAKMYNVPSKCPFPAEKICGDKDKKINIGKYKKQLGLAAGNINVKLEIDHDTGKSCVDVGVSLTKSRARG